MSKNYLLMYSEQLATDIELMCQSIKAPSNTLFQIRKSSSSIYANIREANYGQSKSDMVSKFEIALKFKGAIVKTKTVMAKNHLFYICSRAWVLYTFYKLLTKRKRSGVRPLLLLFVKTAQSKRARVLSLFTSCLSFCSSHRKRQPRS